MTIFYRGPRGLVTDQVIATDKTGWRRLTVAGLAEVHIVRSRAGRWPVGRLTWTLRASWAGTVVVLYESRDRREFDQVCRALRRVLERGGDVAGRRAG